MTAEGWPETPEEISAVVRSERFQADARSLKHVLTSPEQWGLDATLFDLKRRYGPGLVAGMMEWEEA